MPAKPRRLDQVMVQRGLATSRSQAENYIKLGYATVDGRPTTKASLLISDNQVIKITLDQLYVSRAALKLASVASRLGLDFRGKNVLDVGSSTGGFTDYVLRHDAKKVIAVEVGTKQLHPSLWDNPRIELHEQTDIRDINDLAIPIDIVLVDVSFVSVRKILPHISQLIDPFTIIAAMVKPQFEAPGAHFKHKGVIKNDRLRRDILDDFESWAQGFFVVLDKADSKVSGVKGNRERFYLLKKVGRG